MSAWLSDFGQFLWDVINNWAGYSTGGVIVALLALWQTLKQIPLSRKFGIGIAILFLFLAIFNAWREQHLAALTAQKKLDDLTLPQLTSDLIVAYGKIGVNGQDTMMTIAGLIKNQGAPSILDKWRAEVKFNDGRTFQAQIPVAPNEHSVITAIKPDGTGSIYLRGSEWWPIVAHSAPIVRGGAASGWISLLFSGLQAQEAHDKKATVTLYFRDINGREWSFPFELGGQNINAFGIEDIPGIKVKPLQQRKQ